MRRINLQIKSNAPRTLRRALAAFAALAFAVGGTALLAVAADHRGAEALNPVAAVAAASASPARFNADPIRIGAYDSRAVAVAYVRSDLSAGKLQDLLRQRSEAEKSGDKKAVEALNALGESMQIRRHLQGFSNAPVDDVLDVVRDKLPEVAQKANVAALTSRADYHHPSVELVDVTDDLVQLFNPDKQTLSVIKDLRKKEPLPIEDVARMPAVK